MKKIFFLIILILSFQTLSLADNIRYFQIEGMKIGDSALDYFSESQLEDNEQGCTIIVIMNIQPHTCPAKVFITGF